MTDWKHYGYSGPKSDHYRGPHRIKSEGARWFTYSTGAVVFGLCVVVAIVWLSVG